MYPEKIEAWRCSDGKVFTWERGATCHEQDIGKSERANAALEEGKTIAECLHIWGVEAVAPIFEQMTKDTQLVISHWQCRDEPGYKVCEFKSDGSIFVWGNAGSWSGAYGNDVSLQDLKRYAESTLERRSVE